MKSYDFRWDTDPESFKRRDIIIDANNEIIHKGALSIKQNWNSYTQEDHEVWDLLYRRQLENLQEIAYSPWVENTYKIGLEPLQIPKFLDLAKNMVSQTGWLPVPVSGFLDSMDYFAYLSRREFPTAVKIRPKAQWDFITAPDLFHDAFGHLPMHTHKVFADFLELFGKTACQSKTEQQIQEMSRIYWFTVEYGLIKENGKVKVCGSGHMSGFKEARYSLTDEVVKRPFVLEDVIKQEYDHSVLQKTLFVMDSYDQLYDAMLIKAKEFGLKI